MVGLLFEGLLVWVQVDFKLLSLLQSTCAIDVIFEVEAHK